MITNKGKEGRNVHRGNIMSRQIREARQKNSQKTWKAESLLSTLQFNLPSLPKISQSPTQLTKNVCDLGEVTLSLGLAGNIRAVHHA